MTEDEEYNRVCWHSRRGMLELDLLLAPFAAECYRSLSEQDRAAYRRLLDCEDQDLFAWLVGRLEPGDEELAAIVGKVLAHNRPAA